MRKKIFSIVLFLFVNGVLYSLSAENKFLNNLEKLYNQQEQRVHSFVATKKELKQATSYLEKYRKKIPFIRTKISDYLYWLLKKNMVFYEDKILSHKFDKLPVITIDKLYEYFASRIETKQFNLKSGDIILLLPKKWKALRISTLIQADYEHIDIIYVDQNNDSFVLEMSEGNDLQKVPLSIYLLGRNVANIRFQIIRCKTPFDTLLMEKSLQYLLDNQNNIYYDYYFITKLHEFNCNDFLRTSKFLYCGELVYSIYYYVMKNDTFDSGINYPVSRYLKRANNGVHQKLPFLAELCDYFDNNPKEYIIIPQNFLFSDKFFTTALMNENS